MNQITTEPGIFTRSFLRKDRQYRQIGEWSQEKKFAPQVLQALKRIAPEIAEDFLDGSQIFLDQVAVHAAEPTSTAVEAVLDHVNWVFGFWMDMSDHNIVAVLFEDISSEESIPCMPRENVDV